MTEYFVYFLSEDGQYTGQSMLVWCNTPEEAKSLAGKHFPQNPGKIMVKEQ